MLQLPYTTVVVPVDFSNPSLEAVEFVRGAMNGGTIHVITVLEHMHVADPVAVWGEVHDRDRITKTEDHLRHKLGPHLEGLTIQAQVGSPALRIVEFAKELGAEIIVLPTHGRTGAERLFLGSVAERVARMAHCPVLILRRT